MFSGDFKLERCQQYSFAFVKLTLNLITCSNLTVSTLDQGPQKLI